MQPKFTGGMSRPNSSLEKYKISSLPDCGLTPSLINPIAKAIRTRGRPIFFISSAVGIKRGKNCVPSPSVCISWEALLIPSSLSLKSYFSLRNEICLTNLKGKRFVIDTIAISFILELPSIISTPPFLLPLNISLSFSEKFPDSLESGIITENWDTAV